MSETSSSPLSPVTATPAATATPSSSSAALPAVTARKMVEASTDEFGKVLPERIGKERFTRWALTCLRIPDVAEVLGTEHGRLSVIGALMDCASLGLEPGRTYHLVKFGEIVAGITDYKGEIELITNARECSVIAQLVHAKDSIVMTGANIPPVHTADWFGDRGPVIGGYAYVAYPNGEYSLVVHMSEEMFLRHKAKSRTRSGQVWDEWPEAMRLKTLIHQLRKWVPWSAEVIR